MIVLTLSAEPFARCYGLIIIDDDYLIEIDESKIPNDIIEKLKSWYLKYSKYVNKTLDYLESIYDEILLPLDEEGIAIVKEIYDRKIFLDVEKYVYWSRGKDLPLLSLVFTSGGNSRQGNKL